MTELLCIETHPLRVVVAGETYIMIGERSSPCCGLVEVNVGLIHNRLVRQCTQCGNTYFNTDNIYWLRSSRFAQIGTEDECEQYGEKVLIEK